LNQQTEEKRKYILRGLRGKISLILHYA